jgi:small GTP-binding protein
MTAFRVVLLGEPAVGKTTIAKKFAKQTHSEHYLPTIGSDCISSSIVLDHQEFTILLRDTAGQEMFHSLVPVYCRDVHGSVIVFSITDRPSFLKIPKWAGFLTNESPNAVILVFGNKTDLEEQRAVTSEEGKQFCIEKGFLYMEGSGRTGEGIEAIFTQIVVRCRENQKQTKVFDGPIANPSQSQCGC